MKFKRFAFIFLIGASLLFNHSANTQTPSLKPEKYSTLSFRFGTSLVREFGFFLNPVVKKHPLLIVGLGYRSKTENDLTDNCFTTNPIGKVINKGTSGPYIIAGFDFKNKVGMRRVVNPAVLFQLRRLKAEHLTFYGCMDARDSIHHNFDTKTFDVNSKLILDIGGNESFADFYVGVGLGFRFAKNTLHLYHGMPVDKTERLVIPLFSFDMGIRLSFMGSEEPRGSLPSSAIPR
ncbi:MAG: hypothetical protein K9J46_02405 [Saprospiraceae bacterium]|nr:hypothetical protein [Saprospiraceae bacterium]